LDSQRGRAARADKSQAEAKSPRLQTHNRNEGSHRKGAGGKGAPQAALTDPTASEEARKLALAIVAAGLDKKATGIEILDVTGKVDYADLLVLMTGRSDRHVAAIAKGVQFDLKDKAGVMPLSVEGMTSATWVLIDFNDVVVHVFQQEARFFYDLEGLWLDAGRMSVPTPERLSERPPRSSDDQ
jgi:ribosome-associated protein